MKNGVSKHTLRKNRKDDHTVELVKSPIIGKSTLLIHIHDCHL
jgi:hypothetical protein